GYRAHRRRARRPRRRPRVARRHDLGRQRGGCCLALAEPLWGERDVPGTREPPLARPHRFAVPYEEEPKLAHNPVILPRIGPPSGGRFAGQDDAELAGEVRCESDILLNPEGPEEVVRGPEVRHERRTVALGTRQRGWVEVGAGELVPRADGREGLPRRGELRLGLGGGAAR